MLFQNKEYILSSASEASVKLKIGSGSISPNKITPIYPAGFSEYGWDTLLRRIDWCFPSFFVSNVFKRK